MRKHVVGRIFLSVALSLHAKTVVHETKFVISNGGRNKYLSVIELLERKRNCGYSSESEHEELSA